MKVLIVYWTGSGNTQEMAESVKTGAKEGGADVTMKFVSEVSTDEVSDYDRIALGCPCMGTESLEEGEMEPFIDSIQALISGKKIVLFGSYGWGGGQYMEDWQKKMEGYGAIVVAPPVTCNGAPDTGVTAELVELGKQLVK